MSNMEFLDPQEAEKFKKPKGIEYGRTPCMLTFVNCYQKSYCIFSGPIFPLIICVLAPKKMYLLE